MAQREMFRTFNMGLGMVLVAPSAAAAEILAYLQGQGEAAYLVGQIEAKATGETGVDLV